MTAPDSLNALPLHDWHIAHGAKMVPFAGYHMPVQYAAGVMKEHVHCRQAAGLFDVSHMGQVTISAKSDNFADAQMALETLIPADVLGLAEGRQRYSQFLNAEGGVMDDLMFANRGDHLFLVVNASNKAADIAHLQAHIGERCQITALADRALLALQGPQAVDVLSTLNADVATMRFMDVRALALSGIEVIVSRSGYTGEDGFEISVSARDVAALADLFVADTRVMLIGLGARDSLRLEAGLCLHGNDLDASISPIEAGLEWSIQKTRRAGGFLGAERVLREFQEGPSRRRVGLKADGRAPVRGGAPLFATHEDAEPIGFVSSGGFGPTVGGPVAMGYVPTAQTPIGTELFAEVRGQRLLMRVHSLPFVPNGFKR